jgi:WD40 repeat protein
VSSASGNSSTTCLSWGMNDELLSGNHDILLHSFQSQNPELLWNIRSSTLEIFTELSRLSNPLRHLSFSPDGSLFASLGEVRYCRRPLLISSTIKPSRFGTEFRLQFYQTSHLSICRFPVLLCTCNGSFLSTSNSAILAEFGLMGLGTWRMCFSPSRSIIP